MRESQLAADAATQQQQLSEEGDAEDDEEAERNKEFAARRLSVHNPYDEDWNEVGEDGDDANGPAKPGTTQRA